MNIFQFQFDFAFHDYENTVKYVSSMTLFQQSQDGTDKEYLSNASILRKTGKKRKKYALKHIILSILNFVAHRIKFGGFELICTYDLGL